jgi:hypothetical protein
MSFIALVWNNAIDMDKLAGRRRVRSGVRDHGARIEAEPGLEPGDRIEFKIID